MDMLIGRLGSAQYCFNGQEHIEPWVVAVVMKPNSSHKWLVVDLMYDLCSRNPLEGMRRKRDIEAAVVLYKMEEKERKAENGGRPYHAFPLIDK